jgi:hypothetical protein
VRWLSPTESRYSSQWASIRGYHSMRFNIFECQLRYAAGETFRNWISPPVVRSGLRIMGPFEPVQMLLMIFLAGHKFGPSGSSFMYIRRTASSLTSGEFVGSDNPRERRPRIPSPVWKPVWTW